jgi:hypothetical protein
VKSPWRCLLIVTALVAGSLLLVACDGEEDEEAAPPAAATATEEVVDEDGEEAAPTATEEAEDEDGAAVVPSDLADLDSYRYNVELTIEGMGGEGMEGFEGPFAIRQEGAFVAPDKHQAKCSFDLGPLSMEEEVITIGGTSWVKSAESPSFQEGEPMFCTGDFTPGEIFGTFPAEDIESLEGDKDEVNGVDAIHYSVDRAQLDELLALALAMGGEGAEDLPEDLEFNVDVWLAEDGGWPVKILFDFSGDVDGGEVSFTLESNVTDVNSDIEIEAP